MSFIESIAREIQEDARFVGAWLGNKTRGGTFEGRRGPVVGIRGWMAGWPEDGLPNYMKGGDVGGILTDFGRQDGRVDYYVDKLHEVVKEWRDPVLVGMSMGGIVVARYAQRIGWENIKGAMVVGVPLGGVKWFECVKMWGGVYADLAPNSQLLRELGKLIVPEGKQLVGIYADNDLKIGPPARHMTIPFTKTVVIPNVAHGEVQRNQKLWRELDKIVGGREL
ncbi:MAG: hypothetical protein UU93_C0001G0025 [Candidatus Amesbacteria bacterium GW2011_GWA2_42_12]|uniref:Serine aminopeptidase S33 domain-containing protein n=1 Tax=Candidatus Amesbacteria bacterium GW2011_GWA2_42_12 TaxID=1618356 RepID=A0A0G0Y931_9BACT|nr:MAG: hypothetical protein UU93_C0001G0025 [Candidatus Amesbacteria bacterium GW2011_GWA2_42_12]